MRRVVEKDITTVDAVKYYHSYLKEKSIIPFKSINDDMLITETML